MKAKTPHPPGSPEAVKLGCQCAILDNCHGKGAYVDSASNPVYWYNDSCPLHGGKMAKPVKLETILYKI